MTLVPLDLDLRIDLPFPGRLDEQLVVTLVLARIFACELADCIVEGPSGPMCPAAMAASPERACAHASACSHMRSCFPTTKPASFDFPQQHERFGDLIRVYNHERPHQALGGA